MLRIILCLLRPDITGNVPSPSRCCVLTWAYCRFSLAGEDTRSVSFVRHVADDVAFYDRRQSRLACFSMEPEMLVGFLRPRVCVRVFRTFPTPLLIGVFSKAYCKSRREIPLGSIFMLAMQILLRSEFFSVQFSEATRCGDRIRRWRRRSRRNIRTRLDATSLAERRRLA